MSNITHTFAAYCHIVKPKALGFEEESMRVINKFGLIHVRGTVALFDGQLRQCKQNISDCRTVRLFVFVQISHF